jgi:kynureninase
VEGAVLNVASLREHPSPLAPAYARFRVGERLLLTGHSHQAWPDVAWEGVQEAYADAAEHVDDKWGRAFGKADRVRRGYAARLADPDGDYALGASVHELLVRFLSALPLGERPWLVTTDGEFHSLRRQLDRLGEAGVKIERVPAHPAADVGERLAAAVCEGAAAVLVSAVFFETAHVAGGLRALAARCAEVGAELLVDVYHALNVMPFPLAAHGLERAFVTGGGYKYMQLGEGCCFLRIPPGCRLRPVVTGWFAEFETLDRAAEASAVPYPGGAGRFAGATYDPVSHYRASRVLDFFDAQGLTQELLREVSLHQIGVLERGFDALGLDPAVIDRDRGVPKERRGGFLALRAPGAARLVAALRARGVHTDARGGTLRLGPAPYLSDRQLGDALAALGEVARAVV